MTLEQFDKAKKLAAAITSYSNKRDRIIENLDRECINTVSIGEDVPITRPFLRDLFSRFRPLIEQDFNKKIAELEAEFEAL